MKPLALDLCSGLCGWSEGLEATGWDVIRLDIADMFAETGTPKPSPCLLIVQDMLTFHGAQAKDCRLVVASPPCQEFSYRAMPWKRAKALAPELVGLEPPDWWSKPTGKMTLAERAEWAAWQKAHPLPPPSLALFDACFRIQREACEASGRHIPMLVENVRGAIPWVGRSKYHFGSFHLWGDVPALMPQPHRSSATKAPGLGAGWVHPDDPRHTPGLDFTRLAARSEEDGRKVPGFRFDGSGRSFQTASVEGTKVSNHQHIRNGARSTPHLTNQAENVAEGLKHGGDWFSDPSSPSRQGGQRKIAEGRKGAGAGAEWFDANLCALSSKSSARKAASALIARIPLTLSTWIGEVYLPR